MKNYLFFLFLFIFSNAFGQDDEIVSIGVRKFISSKVLGEKRELLIYSPEDLQVENGKQNAYPVLYLLDGASNFHMTTGIIEYLSKSNMCPQMIVVGIRSTDRGRDFTPTKMPLWETSGEADDFRRFISSELIPYIDSKYTTASYKMLVGHSLGGLFTLHTLLKEPGIFNSYIAIDPALGWDDGYLLKKYRDTTAVLDLSGRELYLSNRSPYNRYDTIQLANDTSRSARNFRTVISFCDIIDSLKIQHDFHSKYRFYENEAHSTIPVPSIHDGVRQLFDFFHPPKIENDVEFLSDVKAIIVNHYKEISSRLGIIVYPPNNLLEDVMYLLELNNMHDELEEILELRELN